MRFEAGTPEQMLTESEASEQGLETLRTTSPKNKTLQIRQSRGNPSYAKRVQIPQVPNISAKSPNAESSNLLVKKAKQPSVSPHRINNFVCESSPNRLILDFGNTSNGLENSSILQQTDEKLSLNGSDFSGASTGHNSSTECSSTRSSVGLLEKMKQKTRTSIKRSISSVSNKNRNRKENSSWNNESKTDLSKCNPNSKDFINYKYSPTNSSLTLSTISITHNSMTSLQSNHTLTSSAHQYCKANPTRQSRQNSLQSSIISVNDKANASLNNSLNNEPIYGTSRRHITKPNHAPPPPPGQATKPSRAPPPPPITNGSSIIENVPFITPVMDDKELDASPTFKELSSKTKVEIKNPIKASNLEHDVAALDVSVSIQTEPKASEKERNITERGVKNLKLEKKTEISKPETPVEDFKIDLHVDLVSKIICCKIPV